MRHFLIVFLLVIAIAANAEDRISVQVLKSSTMTPVDTLYIGLPCQFELSFECANVEGLDAVFLCFRFYSENGVSWSQDGQIDGYPDTGLKAVTFYPDTPFSPPEDAWDFFFDIYEFDVDGSSPDSIGFGPVIFHDISPFPMQPMMAIHFTLQDIDAGESGMMCVDSTYPFYYWDSYGKSRGFFWHPEFDGPFCWPVKRFIRDDFDIDGQITVGDAVELINVIFRGKAPVGPPEVGDANCDGSFNVGDALYLIAYIFKFGPAPGCP